MRLRVLFSSDGESVTCDQMLRAREMRKIFNVFFLSFRTPLGYLGFWKEKRAQPRKSEKGEGTDNALIKVQVGR